MERYHHYLTVATQLEVPQLDYLPRLRRFLERRRDFFRLTSEQWLNSPPSQPVTLNAPQHIAVVLEGERVQNGYRGLYFPDIDLIAEIPEEHRKDFSGWRIDGKIAATSAVLTFKAQRPTRIEAVFKNAPSHSAATPAESAQPVTPPPPARIVWRTVPAGESWMGCVPSDDRCDRAENPRVPNVITQPFEMLDREVSGSDFRAFTVQTSRQMPRQPEWYADLSHPVVNVTWDEAQAYCAWIGGRLPTEQEWEHAARGGLDGRLFPWGDDFAGQANARHNLPAERFEFTAPTGSFPPNAFGLHDMAGNVWEWTASEFTPTLTSGPLGGAYEQRTIRGGGWDNIISRLRVSERVALSRHGRHNLYVGFRCVR